MKVIYLWLQNNIPVYVGKSINWDNRYNHYKGILRGTCQPDKNKDGSPKLNEAKMAAHPEQFTYKILEIQNDNCSDEMLSKAEIFWIKYYNTFRDDNPIAFNLTTGGESGMQMSKETRQRISENRKGTIFTEEHKQHLSEAHKNKYGEETSFFGHKHKEESKKIMSQKKIGNHCRPTTPIRCITDNKEYNSIKSVCENKEYKKVYPGNISKCCRGELKHTGYLADGTPLEFEYII